MVSTLLDLNNRGIRYLQEDRHDEAAHLFQSALMRLRDLLYGDIEPAVDPNQDYDVSMLQDDSATICVCVAGNKREHHAAAHTFENQFSVYDHAFTTPGRRMEQEVLASIDVENLTSACLLYNLGLCYHKRALVTGKSRDLHQAVSLYKKAASLVEYISDAAEHSLLLALALFNNMGHIYAEQFNAKEATRCMDSMEMILDSNECQDCVGEDEYYFFSFHFFVFPERQVCLAPAA